MGLQETTHADMGKGVGMELKDAENGIVEDEKAEQRQAHDDDMDQEEKRDGDVDGVHHKLTGNDQSPPSALVLAGNIQERFQAYRNKKGEQEPAETTLGRQAVKASVFGITCVSQNVGGGGKDVKVRIVFQGKAHYVGTWNVEELS